jgi:oligopeptide transport system substrate-binding protein
MGSTRVVVHCRGWLASLALVALLAGCSRDAPAPDTATARAADAAILRVGNNQEPDSLDPQLASLDQAGNILRDVYEGLTTLDDDARAAPGVAERWDVSDDGEQYTFHLRGDARWSNGEPVTAQDFLATFRRLVDPRTASPYASTLRLVVNAADITAGKAAPDTLGVAAPDPRTLVVRLATPAPHFPALLAHWSALPTYRGQPPARPGETVTNGPFVLSAWVPGSHVEARRNRSYWNDANTKLDGVRYFHFADVEAEYTRYRAGDLDVTSELPKTVPLDELRALHGSEVRTAPRLGIYYYGFNLRAPPFAKAPELREALSMTVDRDRLVKSVTAKGERPAYGWVPDGFPDYTPQRSSWASLPYVERVALARRLYAKAGYSAAKPLRFELRYNTGSAHERIALAVSAMWKEALGVEVKLVPEEFKSMLQAIQRGETQMFRSSWTADYPDVASFAEVFRSSFELNLPRFASADYDRLVAAAAVARTASERRALLEAAERELAVVTPIVPLYFMVSQRLVSARVEGWVSNAMSFSYARRLTLRARR